MTAVGSAEDHFVLGLDLDGTCADFYGRMREIAAEWTDTALADLSSEPDWNLTSWGLGEGDYVRLHRFAVTQRDLFESMAPMPGAPQALRRLSNEGVRIRIITHRLFIAYFHEAAVAQTVRWLDHHGVPYWDLCFMGKKGAVGADLYVEDSPENITDLRRLGKDVLIFSNATNRALPDEPGARASTWAEAEGIIRDRYHSWLDARDLARPAGPGMRPPWLHATD